MPAPSTRLTTDVEKYISDLKKGDVLLFDTIHPLSQLIKFAENRPVNHCALYLGDRMFAHVGRHQPDPANPDGPPLKPAARIEQLDEWLNAQPGPHDRTVTALRHVDLRRRGTRADAVEACARSYVAPRDTTYNYVSLITLMVPSLLRTYENYFRDTGALGLISRTLKSVSSAIIDVLEREAAPRRSDRHATLTCSEYVFRCFDEAVPPVKVDVTRPIGRWPTPADLRSPPAARGAAAAMAEAAPTVSSRTVGRGPGVEVVDGAGLVVFDDSFRADFLGPPEELVPVVPAGADAPRSLARIAGPEVAGRRLDMAKLAGKVIIDMIWSNRSLGKYEKDVDAADAGDVFADLVTPRDLWSSRSFSPVAVLHRPPSPADTDLDGVPRPTDLLGG